MVSLLRAIYGQHPFYPRAGRWAVLGFLTMVGLLHGSVVAAGPSRTVTFEDLEKGYPGSTLAVAPTGKLVAAEVESALVAHHLVAEAAVVAFPHDIKGQAIHAYVTLNAGEKRSVR